MQRVFHNLIANAIHHSYRHSKVEILIKNQYQFTEVQILDQGQGVNIEELAHLFERFYRGHSDRQTKGTGLGLYLSRQIVEAHGGKIWAESRSPRGTAFAFALPNIIPEHILKK